MLKCPADVIVGKGVEHLQLNRCRKSLSKTKKSRQPLSHFDSSGFYQPHFPRQRITGLSHILVGSFEDGFVMSFEGSTTRSSVQARLWQRWDGWPGETAFMAKSHHPGLEHGIHRKICVTRCMRLNYATWLILGLKGLPRTRTEPWFWYGMTLQRARPWSTY